MKETLSDQQNEAILKALDQAIKNGPWGESNFLRVIGKNLLDVRECFANHLGTRSHAQKETDTHVDNLVALRNGQEEIFVSLYSSDGANLESWEKIVANLPRQMISRPIYASEKHLKEVIAAKVNKENEAYIGIYVNKTDIISLTPDKTLVDKFGNALITVKDKTLSLENITRFIHSSGVYQFDRGRLVK